MGIRKITLGEIDQFILDHVIKGDKGDGIPNVLSADNTFVMGLRQKPITTKKLMEISYDTSSLEGEIKRNFLRNKALIDFDQIPEEIERQIIDAYESQEFGDRSKLFNFFMEKRMKNLMNSIQEF